MDAKPVIGLMISQRDSHSRAMIAGVLAYLRENNMPWRAHIPGREPDEPMEHLDAWTGAGVIAQVTSMDRAEKLAAWGRLVVNVSGVSGRLPFAQVISDNRAVGKAAAEHLMDRGFRHFACVAMNRQLFSRERTAGFLRTLRDAGFRARTIHGNSALKDFLQAAPKPLGVFAINDTRGRHVLDACLEAGIPVPEAVAVVGVDNDEFQCELSGIPLSSVATGSVRIGHVAAAAMTDLLAGRHVGRRLVAPMGIIRRKSSDILCISEPDVATSLRFIEEHVHEPITVESLLRHVATSRRRLERLFRQHLGRTPHDEIRRVRLDRAKSLLAETDLSMASIAERCGFANQKMLASVFRQIVGETPTAYRRRFRLDS